MDVSKLNVLSRRILSIIVDHMIITLLLIFLHYISIAIVNVLTLDESFLLISFAISVFVLYVCKDIFNGQSPGKRIFKLKVVNKTNGETASKLKTILRNLFVIIWPIEIVIILINPEKRLGDKLANTKIIYFS